MKLKVFGALAIAGIIGFSGMAKAGVNDGLVAHYPFDGDAIDASGNGNDGTVNGATLTEDRFGNTNSAYSFGGVDDLIALGESSLIGSDNDSFSASLWVNLNQVVGEGTHNSDFLLRLKQDTEFFLVFYKPTGQSQLYLYSIFRGATQWGVPVNENDFIGQWNHITVIYNGDDKSTASSYELYLNGIKLPPGTTNLGTAGGIQYNTNVFGADMVNNATANALNGSLDDIRIYNRALSEAEIQEFYDPSCTSPTNGFTQADIDAAYSSGYSAGLAVNSGGSSTSSLATVSADLDIHIPFAEYSTLLGTMSLWANFEYIGANDSGELLWTLSDFGQLD